MTSYAMLPKSGTASLQERMHDFLRNATKIRDSIPARAHACPFAQCYKFRDSIPAKAHACLFTQCCHNHGTSSLQGRLKTLLPYNAQVQLLIVHSGFLEALALQEGLVST